MNPTAKVIEVIKVTTVEGEGTDSDPMRTITRYFSLKGEFLAKLDTLTDDGEKQAFDSVEKWAMDQINPKRP